MTAQDSTGPRERTGRPAEASRPRRTSGVGVALLAGLALTGLTLTGTAVDAADWPASMAAVGHAAAPTPTADAAPGKITFRVLPAPTSAPPTPTAQPSTPPTPTAQPSTPPTPTPSGGQLPVTGGDPPPGWAPALGVLLLLNGGLVVVLARRSRRTPPGPAGQH